MSGALATKHLAFADMSIGDEVVTDVTYSQSAISRSAKRLGFKLKSESRVVAGKWDGYRVKRIA